MVDHQKIVRFFIGFFVDKGGILGYMYTKQRVSKLQ